jgi:hypothetical protein
MIETIGKLVPLDAFGPVLLAGVAWAGFSWLMAPEIGARMGAITYQPVCEADVAILQREHRADYERKRRFLQAEADRVRRAAEIARRKAALLENMTRAFIPPELRQGAAGEFVGLLMQSVAPPVTPTVDEPKVAVVPLPLSAPVRETRETFCRCVIGRAVSEARTDFAIYTGTLTLHVPEPVRHFEAGMASVARTDACGPIPLS